MNQTSRPPGTTGRSRRIRATSRFFFDCRHCAFSTSCQRSYVVHMSKKHGTNVYVCPESNCSNSFKSKSALNSHQTTHECFECGHNGVPFSHVHDNGKITFQEKKQVGSLRHSSSSRVFSRSPAGASALFAGPSTSFAGPSTSFAGPSTSFAGPSTSFAGPSTSFACPSASFSCPSIFPCPAESYVNLSTSLVGSSTSFAVPELPTPGVLPKGFLRRGYRNGQLYWSFTGSQRPLPFQTSQLSINGSGQEPIISQMARSHIAEIPGTAEDFDPNDESTNIGINIQDWLSEEDSL